MTFVKLAIFLNFRKFGKLRKPHLLGGELIYSITKSAKIHKFCNTLPKNCSAGDFSQFTQIL